MRLLTFRDHSREEMRKKLAQRGFAEEDTRRALNRLTADGLLDDARYAGRLAAALAREKSLGSEGIRRRLFQKGIAAEFVEEACSRLETECASILRLKRTLEKKLRGREPQSLSPKEKQKLAAYLRGRGFPWEDIFQVWQES